MEIIYILFLVGYYIFKYMAKKKKEEEAKKMTQSKPVPQSSPKKVNTPKRTINEPKAPPVWEERNQHHLPEEKTIVLTNEPSPTNEPTLKDIFKQLLEGGGDIHKEPVKPKAEPKPFLDFESNRKSARKAFEARVEKTTQSQQQLKPLQVQVPKSQQKLQNVMRNTSLRDMVLAKAILDTPYINKDY